MKKLLLSWSAIGLFSLYVAYKSYQEKQSALAKLTHYEQMIKCKDKKLVHYQVINEQIRKDKLKAEATSIALKRQLKQELEKTPCADERVPTRIANKRHNRVLPMRQSAQ